MDNIKLEMTPKQRNQIRNLLDRNGAKRGSGKKFALLSEPKVNYGSIIISFISEKQARIINEAGKKAKIWD